RPEAPARGRQPLPGRVLSRPGELAESNFICASWCPPLYWESSFPYPPHTPLSQGNAVTGGKPPPQANPPDQPNVFPESSPLGTRPGVVIREPVDFPCPARGYVLAGVSLHGLLFLCTASGFLCTASGFLCTASGFLCTDFGFFARVLG